MKRNAMLLTAVALILALNISAETYPRTVLLEEFTSTT